MSVDFSIIIPVYNTEKYLYECLNSILNQTYKNFEVICIDDNSSDNSKAILETLQKNECKIKIIKNTNSVGAGDARNQGLKIAKGKYICFVDSDDIISEHLLEKAKNSLSPQADILIFGAKTKNNKNKKIYTGQYSAKNFTKNFQSNIFQYHTVAWNKIYRRDFLVNNNILFSNTKTGEDQIFFIKSLINAQTINILKEDLYIYRKYRENALTNTKIKNDLSPIYNLYNIVDYLEDITIPEKLKYKILTHYLIKAVSWYNKTTKSVENQYYKDLEKAIEHLKIKTKRYWWDYYSTPKLKLKLIQNFSFLIANFLFFIHEKLIYIPACFLYGLIELSNQRGEKK